MRENSARSTTDGMRRALAGIALLTFLLSGGMAFGAAEPDTEIYTPLKIPKVGMKNGRLTDMREKGAEISGGDYKFHPKIEFGDDEERRVEWKDFKKGDEVQYHLKQEQIDLLIKVLPK